MRYIIKGKEVYTDNEIINNGCVIIKEGLIEDISTKGYEDSMIIDMEKYKILPGLIDSHIHGANGYDTMDCTYKSLNEISKYLAKNGVTSFLPTTVTSSLDKIKLATENIAYSKEKGTEGAGIIGSYIEGPYISQKYKGAHPKEFIRDISIEDIKLLLKSSNDTIKVVALAPEKKGALELIDLLTSKGIKVSLGHSNGTFDITEKAISKGATIGVHIFNGMRGLHHREPGILGSILTNENIYGELISDTIHVHPKAMDILIKSKGADKVYLISDCMMAGGLDDGEYNLGELKVTVKDSMPRLSNGSLAGSTLKLIDGVKNMVEILGINPIDAVNMGSLIPARALGIEDKYGSITKNKRADITIIDDNWNVVMTIVDGKVVYKNT
ncbi:N-acetylglucosamine-6-phosphate deacetylase [Dethiothermospora halolimnae]|uniref:N-acetylglucosamine-6-phosphate deacetylase n=1 Tax=Dethiothermospora halolimnae TaxID=3114390 RepID=UPI003CCBB0E8